MKKNTSKMVVLKKVGIFAGALAVGIGAYILFDEPGVGHFIAIATFVSIVGGTARGLSDWNPAAD
jgi:hypothetical protein